LYTQKCYDEEMLAVTIPEIKRINLSPILLILKTIGIDNIMEFDFLDKPSTSNLILAL